MSDEEKGRQLLAEAEKKVKSGGGMLGGIFGYVHQSGVSLQNSSLSCNLYSGGGSSKVDEAIDLYCKAANQFKMAKNWNAAGKAFSAAADLHLNKQKNKHEAATMLVDAANCVRKVDPNGMFTSITESVAIRNEICWCFEMCFL